MDDSSRASYVQISEEENRAIQDELQANRTLVAQQMITIRNLREQTASLSASLRRREEEARIVGNRITAVQVQTTAVAQQSSMLSRVSAVVSFVGGVFAIFAFGITVFRLVRSIHVRRG